MNAFRRRRFGLAISATAMAFASTAAVAASNGNDGSGAFLARLTGYQEVPAVSTVARGEFKGTVDPRTGLIDYELSYADLQGNVTQAHIHFGQRGVNGGISVWLCGTATNPGPAGTPACPAAGSVVGVIAASNVIGPAGQQLAAGGLAELLKAMRAGVAYVNVHTNLSTGGEIRGQIRHRAQ